MWHFLNCVASGYILFCLDKKVVLKFVHHLSIFAYMILKYILENYESFLIYFLASTFFPLKMNWQSVRMMSTIDILKQNCLQYFLKCVYSRI